MKYKFSKTNVLKTTVFWFFFALFLSFFLLVFVLADSVFLSSWIEVSACGGIAIGAALISFCCSYISYGKKSFTIEERDGQKLLIVYVGDKEARVINLSEAVGINILKSKLFFNTRLVRITTGDDLFKMSVSEAVYREISSDLPYYFKSQKEGLIEIKSGYKLKTLAMKLCVIFFYGVLAILVVVPSIMGAVKGISHRYNVANFSYEKSNRVVLIVSFILLGICLAGYTGFFFVKFFAFSGFKIRIEDGKFTMEYKRISLQKSNYDTKTVIGIKRVRSVFSFLFGLEAFYVIWENANKEGVHNDCIPFCLKKEDCDKIETLLLGEENPQKARNSKKTLFYCIFPCVLLFAVALTTSFFYGFSLMLLLILPAFYFVGYFRNRYYKIGDEKVVFSCGFASRAIYVFKVKSIEGVTTSKRFFEKKARYSTYEILLHGYNGCLPLGVYDDKAYEILKKKIEQA